MNTTDTNPTTTAVETVEETTLTLTEIVTEITNEVFGTDQTISPYKVAKVINMVFKATLTDKEIPAQMMYNYASKGMIEKGNKTKAYTKEAVEAYVNKYTSKHVDI